MVPFSVSKNHNHCLFSTTIVIATSKNMYFSRCHTTRTNSVFGFFCQKVVPEHDVCMHGTPSIHCWISPHVLYFLLIRHFRMLSKLILFTCLFAAFCFSILFLHTQHTAGNVLQRTIRPCTKLRCLEREKIEFDSIAKYFKSTELPFIQSKKSSRMLTKMFKM